MKKDKNIIIFGTGEIGELAHFYFKEDSQYQVSSFVVDDEYYNTDIFLGLPVTKFSEVSQKFPAEDFNAHVALSYSKLNQVREDKYLAMKNKGYKLVSYVCSKSVRWRDLDIGDNCFILENQTIQPTVKIGNNVMIWSGNHLGHGCMIGDHTYISSHVCISGHTKIGTHCFWGVNSSTKDFITIGNSVFITMGSMVVKDIPDGSVVLDSKGSVLLENDPKAQKIKSVYFNL